MLLTLWLPGRGTCQDPDIYWCRSSIFRHLKLELLTQFPASNDEKYINVVYIWRKFVSIYGYVHWRMTTEISVMYGSEKVNVNVVVTEWSPKTKIGINLLDSQLTGLTSEYLYMSPIDLIYYEYLYMSQIDQIY